MNPYIERLYALSRRDSRLVIGLMSGTSLDGLDIALCRINGQGRGTGLELLAFRTMPYSDDFRTRIRSVFAQRRIDQQALSGLNAYIGRVHGQLINETLDEWAINGADVDLIASHGQTVYHAPQRLTADLRFPNSTLQVGDGDHIAVATGIITVSDFRQKHVAAGGEGAPLAAYGDYLLYSAPDENRILLNIGGISNLTFLPATDSDGEAFATDIGPGNTMMNQYMQAFNGAEMDKNGQMAAAGRVDEDLLAALLDEPFLAEEFPKTTGPELFNLTYLDQKISRLNRLELRAEDVMATLNAFSARAIVSAIGMMSTEMAPLVVYASGGGIHNPVLMSAIRTGLPDVTFGDITSLGMDPDAKEACLFAVLANETVAGNPQNVQGIKDSPAVCMGKISLPR